MEAKLDELSRKWARVGAWLTVSPHPSPIDLESLIAETARWSREDPRLFQVAATWLAANHDLVDPIRLESALSKLDDLGSATAGALLSLALSAAGKAPELEAPLRVCRAISPARPLFTVAELSPLFTDFAREDADPLFLRWGFWSGDTALKPGALRGRGWILRHAPELRSRAEQAA
ncbi:MAG TPA: hypothetical protein VF746_16475 [Longimicrobium sp.]